MGNDQFLDVLKEFYDEDAVEEWKRLKVLMEPLAEASGALPPSAVRTDAFAAVTLARWGCIGGVQVVYGGCIVGIGVY